MEVWKERLLDEFKEVNEKREKLKEFLQNHVVDISTDERDMMVMQYSGMMLYQEALDARLEYYNLKAKE